MTHRHTPFFAAVFLTLPLAAPTPVLAQTVAAGPSPDAPPATKAHANDDDDSTTDTRAVAEMLFYTARGLMEDNKVAKACKKFAESYRLDPAAGTLLNLAVCHEKEGKLASAWGEFRQAQAEAHRSNRPDREQLARDAIARIEPDLPYLTITVPPEMRVAGLKIHRNGVPLDDAAWETELPIDPGTNEIKATAPLYKPETQSVSIEKRQHLTVTMEPLALAPIVRPPPPFWTARREIGATAIAGGVVAASVGAVFGVLALSNKSKSDDACPTKDAELRCTTTGASAMSTAQTQAWVADFGLGAGSAAIIAGAVLMITGGAREESGPAPVGAPTSDHARPQTAWGFRFMGGPHGGQGFLTRSF